MTHSEPLTQAQAFEAAYRYVWQYMDREPDPDRVSLQEMLIAMEPTADSARSSDPASFRDWLECVAATQRRDPVPRFPSS
ncbi:hypothetical protein [Aeromicrobium sp.]|uniref:hypothetical protein n=1 Tax=Aeromicrobium sp. TaxID=1871063 RepID=UPI002FC5AC91